MELRPVAGIDISKASSDMCVISPLNEIITETRIFHDLTSMERAARILRDVRNTYHCEPIIVMESTAHYHRILYSFLRNAGFEVLLVNPLQTSLAGNLNIRKVKNDKVDAKRLALLYRLNVLKPSFTDNGLLDTLKDLTRQRAELVNERVRFVNKLTFYLDQAFPGYQKVFPQIRVKSSLAVLARFPTPAVIVKSRKDSIQSVIGKASTRGKNSMFASKKAKLLVDAAKDAMKIGVRRDSFEPLISMTATIIVTLQASIDMLTEKIVSTAATDADFMHNVELVSSIPGIGTFSAIIILAEMGDVRRFSKAKQLVAYCGLDPAVKQSGTFTSTNTKMSKRGSPYLRKILNICTHVAVHPGRKGVSANAVLTGYYEEKCKKKPPKVALCACMHKMVLIIFAVLRDQTPFELRTPEEHMQFKLLAKAA